MENVNTTLRLTADTNIPDVGSIAGCVDPDFNIYEMAMPWAIRRSLSPSTIDGIETLRSTILTKDDRVQWSRVLEFVEAAMIEDEKEMAAAATPDASLSSSSKDMTQSIEEVADTEESSASQSGATNDAVVTLLGSPEGNVLRRIIRDMDSIDLVSRLLSKDAKPLRKQAVMALSTEDMKRRAERRRSKHDGTDIGSNETLGSEIDATDIPSSLTERPMSDECQKLRERQMKWTRKVTMMLVREHLCKQIQAGPKAWLKLSFLSFRLLAGIINRRILFYVRSMRKFMPKPRVV